MAGSETVAFGEFAPCWDAKRRQVVTKTKRVSYFSRVAPAEEFGRMALVEWHRRGGENAQRVVTINDGAVWIQAFIDYHCPQATRVIDYAHAQGYVATVGRAIYRAETRVLPIFVRNCAIGIFPKNVCRCPQSRFLNSSL